MACVQNKFVFKKVLKDCLNTRISVFNQVFDKDDNRGNIRSCLQYW